MKKTLRIVGMALMAILFMLPLTSCGDDDDDDKRPDFTGQRDEQLYGTWKHVELDSDGEEVDVITFKADGTFRQDETDIDNGVTKNYWINGTWSTAGGFVNMIISSTNDPELAVNQQKTVRYMVSKNVLNLDGDQYQKQ